VKALNYLICGYFNSTIFCGNYCKVSTLHNIVNFSFCQLSLIIQLLYTISSSQAQHQCTNPLPTSFFLLALTAPSNTTALVATSWGYFYHPFLTYCFIPCYFLIHSKFHFQMSCISFQQLQPKVESCKECITLYATFSSSTAE